VLSSTLKLLEVAVLVFVALISRLVFETHFNSRAGDMLHLLIPPYRSDKHVLYLLSNLMIVYRPVIMIYASLT
jgi:hypothetical protein